MQAGLLLQTRLRLPQSSQLVQCPAAASEGAGGEATVHHGPIAPAVAPSTFFKGAQMVWRREAGSSSSSSFWRQVQNRKDRMGVNQMSNWQNVVVAIAASSTAANVEGGVAVLGSPNEQKKENGGGSRQLMPSSAEAARTIVDICSEGALSTLSEDEWPTATAVRFALDADGNPVFRFHASARHTRNLALDSRASLHVQLEQPGRRRPQSSLRGRIHKADDPNLLLKFNIAWERRFGKERDEEDAYYFMKVEQVLHAQDMGEEEVWVSGEDFSAAVADPLRDCAPRIVDDMNRQHWEDVRRFCNAHAQLEAEVEEASMTWVDRLGFNVRVLTRSPQTLLEIRIPFSREVSDERDARSSLTMLAQMAWEYERKFSPPEVQVLSSFNVPS